MSETAEPNPVVPGSGPVPIAPSLIPTLQAAKLPPMVVLVDGRVVYISFLAIVLSVVAALVAKGLTCLIGLITNLVFFGELSPVLRAPTGNHLGWWIVAIPVAGGLIVGLMARFGSAGIRGHGIPEAMEKVLTDESRIPARLTFLKPLSAAIAIGTGGPFGAEGPIIATGGAMGSLLGQILSTTAVERKTLLAAGAAAGMSATFGCPVAAVLLAIELLLFEFRPRSFIPVALASAVAAGTRFLLNMPYPVFNLGELHPATPGVLAIYMLIGLIVGVVSVGVTRIVYGIEDLFDKFPIHWMWWPAIGAIPVGVIGYFQPRTLGVGYENISDVLLNHLTLTAAAVLCGLKFISWAIALGSRTSGGTLAPLFTIGGALGLIMGAGASHLFPSAHVELGAAALVGMAAMFAGASRALLASAVFAFETTLQANGLLPLLGGCTAAYLASCLLMRNTIMTEKIARRGVHAPAELEADLLSQLRASDAMSRDPVTISAEELVQTIRLRIASGQRDWEHQGFPIVDSTGLLVGVLTRRDFMDANMSEQKRAGELLKRPPIITYADGSLRDAADHMVNHDVGRVPVVDRRDPGRVVGMITRSDVMAANRRRLNEMKRSTGPDGMSDNRMGVNNDRSNHK
jgi:H+/Cl- antiporter ClcA/CBS domain-containing protein